MSKFWRRFEVFFCAFILVGMSGMNVSGAATVKATVPPQPIRVYAVGGLESATIFWTMPESKTASPVTSFKILIFDVGKAQYQTASDATVTSCPAGVSKCVVAIANPTRNRIPKPAPVNFFFTVTAINQVGASPDSVRAVPLAISFRPSSTPTSTPQVSPKVTPSPKATASPSKSSGYTFRVPSKPVPTPTVTPKVTPTPTKPAIVNPPATTGPITAFDGLYSGSAVVSVSINSGVAATVNYSTTFKVVNGMGGGSAESWTVLGKVTDVKGVASLTASSSIYGSLTFTVNFLQDPATHVMTGNGKGERTENLIGLGEVKVDFVYNVSRQP